jgi:hypothetical protein
MWGSAKERRNVSRKHQDTSVTDSEQALLLSPCLGAAMAVREDLEGRLVDALTTLGGLPGIGVSCTRKSSVCSGGSEML